MQGKAKTTPRKSSDGDVGTNLRFANFVSHSRMISSPRGNLIYRRDKSWEKNPLQKRLSNYENYSEIYENTLILSESLYDSVYDFLHKVGCNVIFNRLFFICVQKQL
jgi:hypothetical protein